MLSRYSPAWLKKMDAFTNYIVNCDEIKTPIKVAILDDGFDMISNEYTEPGTIRDFASVCVAIMIIP